MIKGETISLNIYVNFGKKEIVIYVHKKLNKRQFIHAFM